jgi:hypothetical protein
MIFLSWFSTILRNLKLQIKFLVLHRQKKNEFFGFFEICCTVQNVAKDRGTLVGSRAQS